MWRGVVVGLLARFGDNDGDRLAGAPTVLRPANSGSYRCRRAQETPEVRMLKPTIPRLATS